MTEVDFPDAVCIIRERTAGKQGGIIVRFTKMQGLGNDYVYVNCFKERIEDPSTLAVKMSDRHFGVGSDGLILINPSDKADGDV